MQILVQKFGGTSVAGKDRLELVMGKVRAALDKGYKVAVVLSAMSGETNRLLALAKDFSASPDRAELDCLVSTGEQVTVSLFAMMLRDAGIKARSMLGFQVPILTDSDFTRARIADIDDARMKEHFEEYDVLVVAGFQGVDCRGRITTLGRGGSDTTGVALAAALKAETCEIYTDVLGVYTTDPNICKDARKLNHVSYEEMLELSSMGAKVLQIRSVEFAKKYNVPVRVLSTFSDDPGTLVTKEDEQMEELAVSGIALDRDQCRVTVGKVLDKPGIAAGVFGAIAEKGILVDMIIQNTSREGVTDMTFTVHKSDLGQTMQILEDVKNRIGAADVAFDDKVCKVSLIGVGMRSHSGVAATMFETLRTENINIKLIATSEIKISCLIDEKYGELAVRCLHDAFGLGLVGSKTC